MKKVLFTATVDSHIIHFHIPYLRYFKEQGYEVHVATNGKEQIPYCDKKHTISFERSPYKINNLRAIKNLKTIIDQEHYDIIHTHTPMGSVVTRLAALKARKNGTRVIYTAHGFHFYKGAPILNWLLFYPIEKILSKYTDTLITINQEDYQLALKKFKKTKVEYVPGVGVDPEKFNFKMTKKEKHELRKSLGLKDDDFVMIYAAELNKNKNQGMLLKVMKELIKEHSNIHLLLVGKDSMNGLYQKQAIKLGVEKNAHFLGYRNDVPKLLKISDLAVSTSKREGLPLNIIEALMCGLPVVATNCRGNRDLIEEGTNGYLVEIDDVRKMEESILNVNGIKKTAIDLEKYIFELETIKSKIKSIYSQRINSVAYLRSTSILNDSRSIKEIQSLLDNNISVNVFCWDRDGFLSSTDYIKSQEKKAKIMKYEKRALFGSGKNNLLNMIRFEIWLYKSLKKNINNFGSIHSCNLDTGIVAKIIAKKYNKLLIYDIYDYYSESHYLPIILKSWAEKQEIKIINFSYTTIICNEWRKNQISKSRPRNLSIIHNSPSIDYKLLNQMPNLIKTYSKKIKIVYVGILQGDRLLVEIANLVKGNSKIEFHVGGFGILADYFKDISKKYNNVYFYGAMNYTDVLKLESECDILFATYNPQIPNHRYSAPNKLYEAMALGKPIIVCKDTGVDEFVETYNLGKAIKYDAKDFVRTVIYLSIAKTDYSKSKELFENQYSWDKMKIELEKIYGGGWK